jgi:hypothetical protein
MDFSSPLVSIPMGIYPPLNTAPDRRVSSIWGVSSQPRPKGTISLSENG